MDRVSFQKFFSQSLATGSQFNFSATLTQLIFTFQSGFRFIATGNGQRGKKELNLQQETCQFQTCNVWIISIQNKLFNFTCVTNPASYFSLSDMYPSISPVLPLAIIQSFQFPQISPSFLSPPCLFSCLFLVPAIIFLNTLSCFLPNPFFF